MRNLFVKETEPPVEKYFNTNVAAPGVNPV
jgi:hypothetical protein